MTDTVQMKLLSSLAKIFADEEPQSDLLPGALSGFRNETISFQLAFSTPAMRWDNFVRIEVESPLSACIRLRKVNLVPVGLAAYVDADDNYLRKTAGIYPDLLTDLKDYDLRLISGQWRGVWVDVQPGDDTPPGVHPIHLRLVSDAGELLAAVHTQVEILDARLPAQTLRHTKWFHGDCLAEYYQVPALSARHWEIMENFIALAVRRGINMILTPTFTPPLDTAVGGERLTVQLVDVTVQADGSYRFGFDNLKRWVAMCQRCGVEYFEISHLFTQWGARAAPKVMATVDGELRRIFGWDTPATEKPYADFLAAYLPALTAHLKEWGIAARCYFHISDEPSSDQLQDYIAAKALVAPYLQGFEIIDALSSFDFYQSGALTKPIPANNHIQPFLDAGVKHLWTYYCLGQYVDVSNVFIAMPSARNRILGVQLYKYEIEGFLHWGYNFYNTQYSRARVDPYAVTDGDGFGPSGDAFQVYPGRDGMPEESLRMMVTAQALYDLRALQLLESLAGRAFVLDLIDGDLPEPITFARYPHGADYLFTLRARVNREIMARLAS